MNMPIKTCGTFNLIEGQVTEISISFKKMFLPVVISIFVLTGCSTKSDSANNTSSIKFDQYYLQGEKLYQIHCSNCHQKNGTGLGLLYPPLNTSDFIDSHFEEVICTIKFGKTGELMVNGKKFNKAMPPFPTLSNLEVAEVATYIFNTWSHKRGVVDVKAVDKIISTCSTN